MMKLNTTHLIRKVLKQLFGDAEKLDFMTEIFFKFV